MTTVMQFLMVAFVSIFTPFSSQAQQGQAEKEYFVAEIRASDEKSVFEFEVALLTRSGKEAVLQRYDAKTPFKLSMENYCHLIVRGKNGQGKLGIRYKVENEEKRSFQIFGEGEAVVIEFRPMKKVTGSANTWFEGPGKPFAPLVFTALTKE
jgi:hypothetical protein